MTHSWLMERAIIPRTSVLPIRVMRKLTADVTIAQANVRLRLGI